MSELQRAKARLALVDRVSRARRPLLDAFQVLEELVGWIDRNVVAKGLRPPTREVKRLRQALEALSRELPSLEGAERAQKRSK